MADEKLKPPTQTSQSIPIHHSPPSSPSLLARIANSDLTYKIVQAIALGFLTYNSIEAIYRARSDPWTIAFVVSAYTTLMLLFWSLRAFEKVPAEDLARRGQMKVVIWSLAAALNLMFSYRVSTMLPFALGAVVWTIAGITTLAGFYFFFVYDSPANLDEKIKNPNKL